MRVLHSFGAAAAAIFALTGTNAAPSPNFEVSKTTVSVDRHRELLDNGQVIVRVQRTDDLFSDNIGDDRAKLLAEKTTHIALKIQLDPVAGHININDVPLDLKDHGARVSAVKAETFSLPNHDSPTLHPDDMLSLYSQMSTGLVSVEAKVESEPVSPPLGLATESHSVRKVGVFVRITEIEGKEMQHSTTIFTPILQLLVTGPGNRIEKIATLSINGKPPVMDNVMAPGPATVHGLLAGVPVRKFEPQYKQPQRESSFFTSILRALGFSSSGGKSGRRPFPGAGHRGCSGARKNKVPQNLLDAETQKHAIAGEAVARPALAGHRPMLENPFSGMMDDREDNESRPSKQRLGHHMRPHGRPMRHGRHGKCGGFFRRMAIGFIYGLALAGSVILHPLSLAAYGVLLAGGLAFHVVRRIVKRTRADRAGEGSVRLVGNDEEVESLLFDSEKDEEKQVEVPVHLERVVVVEDEQQPPKYDQEG